jgi:hypothetical protein
MQLRMVMACHTISLIWECTFMVGDLWTLQPLHINNIHAILFLRIFIGFLKIALYHIHSEIRHLIWHSVLICFDIKVLNEPQACTYASGGGEWDGMGWDGGGVHRTPLLSCYTHSHDYAVAETLENFVEGQKIQCTKIDHWEEQFGKLASHQREY